jgi:metal-responsive CopG/Arc/MetJ family transcriptional regulator
MPTAELETLRGTQVTPSRRAERIEKQAEKKVIINFPAELVARTDRAADEEGLNRSEVIRKSVEIFLGSRDRQRRERELATAYAANAPLALEIVEEFGTLEGFLTNAK